MDISKLHYITNGSTEREILDEVEAVLNAGVDWVQLRIKDPALEFEKIALAVQHLCSGRATFIINDNIVLAKKINADGVHLGLEDVPTHEARRILGANKIIGGTANTLENCLMHQENGVDYIGLGPLRMTKTKKKLSPVIGHEGYRTILPIEDCKIHIPVLAIGGIVEEDVKLLMDTTSAFGIAVAGLIAKAINKKEQIARLKELLYNGQ